MVPREWPEDVHFLIEQEWKNMSEYYSKIPPGETKVKVAPKSICKSVKIFKITDVNHPSYPACGLKATCNIPAKTFILDYRGIVTDESKASETSDYILQFDQEFSIDAEFKGNEARFINDFRGIQHKPNVCFELCRNAKGQMCMGVFSLVKISKNQELVVTYGKGFWKARGISFEHEIVY